MQLYKVWVQNKENLSIMDDNTEIFYISITHYERVGIMKMYQIIERNSEYQKKRLKMKLIPSDSKEIKKPTSLKLDYFKGIFYVRSSEDMNRQLKDVISNKIKNEEYSLLILMKTPSKERYYIILLKTIEELNGIYYLIDWLLLDKKIIIKIEDQYGNNVFDPEIIYPKKQFLSGFD